MKKISSILTNKYFLATGFFVVWMLFFDMKDVSTQWDRRQELKKLEQKKHYYEQEITKAKKELSDLQNSPAALEKFARERYMMKKNGEDVFIIEKAGASKN